MANHRKSWTFHFFAIFVLCLVVGFVVNHYTSRPGLGGAAWVGIAFTAAAASVGVAMVSERAGRR